MNIAIAGAGIMGRVLALVLLRSGHKISIYDQDPKGSGIAAAYTAAGMLAPYSEIESTELLIYQMGIRSLKIWSEIARTLGVDIGLHNNGSVIIAHSRDYPDYHRFNSQLLNKISLSPNQMRSLDHQQLHDLEPGLTDSFTEAVYLPDEAWLAPELVMSALAGELSMGQTCWHENTVVNECGRHYLICNGDRCEFDWVIDCRGLGAKPEWSELRGVRGELILLEAPEVNFRHMVRLMHPRYRLYVVPRMHDNLFVIGATQIESDDRGPITVQSVLELLSAAYSMHSGFAQARIVDMKTNCRPALPDNLPKIKYEDGLIRVNGLYRHGFLLAPVIAQEVDHWLNSAGTYRSGYEDLFKRAA